VTPALLLIDLQEDYLGAPGLQPGRGSVVAGASWLLDRCRSAGVPVLHVWTTVHRDRDERMRHWQRDGVWRCVAGTPGHATPTALRPAPGEPVVHKTHFSAFGDGALASLLRDRGVDEVWLAGVHVHACIRAAAIDADRLGFTVKIAADAVASDQPLHADETRRWLARRCAAFVPAEAWLAELGTAAAVTAAAARPAGDAERAAVATLPVAVIDGVAIAGPSGTVAVSRECPAQRGRVLWRAPVATAEHVAAAAGAAQRAGRAWRGTSVADRLAIADRLAAAVAREREPLARRMALEIGKPLADGRLEVDFAIALLHAARRRAEGFLASADPPASSAGVERRRPLGTVALITPWNVPLAIPLGKLAPALLYGNTVVWKPAPAGSRLALDVLRLLAEAGAPPGAVSLVCGDQTTAELLLAHDAIDAASLTGSSAAGTCAQAICAARRIPLQAELGGNNAAIVWSDTDLDDAAAKLAAGAFGSAGQRCTATRRIVVDAACAADFVRRLAAATDALAWGDPLDPATRVGPLVSRAACERVHGVLKRAQEAGARLVVAPSHLERARELADGGAYLAPHLVLGADPRAEIAQEESFGPVAVVQVADGFDTALALLNGVSQGLVAALFSASAERRARFLDESRAGILKVGSATAGVGAQTPFSGWKASGVGPAEHGSGDPEFYTRPQAVYVEGAPPAAARRAG
jgi:acyl-CoA reductase-like NAD-dependent aldehyde dehydrogenase/nicotinamidase-related amidase